MTIWIDARAGSKELIAHPPLDTLGELTTLASGDVCFSGNGDTGPLLVGVEVKSIFDLMTSLQDGRLRATQLPSLAAAYDVRYLLYYGHTRANPDSGALQVGRVWGQKHHDDRETVAWSDYGFGPRPLSYGYLEGFLASPAFTSLNVLVKQVPDAPTAARWLGWLHHTWTKPWDAHTCMQAFDRSHSPPRQGMDKRTHLRATIANDLPGLGYKRAVAAAYHFDSVRAMVNADEKAWAEVEGIGKVIAKSIVAAVS